jgi:FkbM family methyltransferase
MTAVRTPAGMIRVQIPSPTPMQPNRVLKFDIRPDTSDEKALREVVEKKGYGRYHFTPSAGEHWIDLGGNIGAFAVWAAAQDPSITVDCYEADPEMCDIITHNIELNRVDGRVAVYNSAVVADRRRTVTLHCNTARGNVWRNSIERDWRGGVDITVPAYSIASVLKGAATKAEGRPVYMKMDIEGTEMPILEWMLQTKGGVRNTLKGMVFEWSFDVDPSIARFRDVIAGLSTMYDIRNGQITDKMASVEMWPAEWFPAARLVWCWSKK